MNLRRVISLSTLLSSIMIAYTGIMLYLCPQGRVAYWNNWKLLGLTKTEYGDLHTLFSLMFLVVAIFHIYYNWKNILFYLKNRAKQVIFFTKEMSVALFITGAIFIGTYYHIPPFQTVIDFGTYLKDGWSESLEEPPYGHAELSTLATFTTHIGVDIGIAIKALQSKGLKNITKDIILEDLAKRNKLRPSDILKIINSFQTKSGVTLPKQTKQRKGHSHRSLKEVCEVEGVDPSLIRNKIFNKYNKKINLKDNFKKAAQSLEVHPMDLLNFIKK